MSEQASAATRIRTFIERWAWLVLAATIVFAFGIRWRLREMPLERDEGEYAYVGQLMLEGGVPYKEAYTMKLPGTHAAYAAIMAILGETESGIHTGLAVVNAISILLVFLLTRRLFDKVAGLAAALSFALLSLSPSVLGLMGHATHFVALTALGGTLVLLHTLESGRWGDAVNSMDAPAPAASSANSSRPTSFAGWQLFASGLLFGLCYLMKQHGVFFGMFAAVALIVNDLKTRAGSSNAPYRVLRWAAFVMGFALPYGLTCLLLWRGNAFKQFVFWTMTYARIYAGLVPISLAPAMFWRAIRQVAQSDLLLWCLAVAGIVLACGRKRLTAYYTFHSFRGVVMFIAFVAASMAVVCPGFIFRDHYFIAALPAVALLGGLTTSFSLSLMDGTGARRWAGWLGIGLFVLGLTQTLLANGRVFFELSPKDALVGHYLSTSYVAAKEAGEQLGLRTSVNDRIAVIGSEPEIYFFARRRAATGHLYLYPVLERHALAQAMQKQMITEIEANKPEYVVYMNDDISWLTPSGSPRELLEWWKMYWRSNLVPEKVIYLQKTDASGQYAQQALNASKDPKALIILRRKKEGASNP